MPGALQCGRGKRGPERSSSLPRVPAQWASSSSWLAPTSSGWQQCHPAGWLSQEGLSRATGGGARALPSLRNVRGGPGSPVTSDRLPCPCPRVSSWHWSQGVRPHAPPRLPVHHPLEVGCSLPAGLAGTVSACVGAGSAGEWNRPASPCRWPLVGWAGGGMLAGRSSLWGRIPGAVCAPPPLVFISSHSRCYGPKSRTARQGLVFPTVPDAPTCDGRGVAASCGVPQDRPGWLWAMHIPSLAPWTLVTFKQTARGRASAPSPDPVPS